MLRVGDGRRKIKNLIQGEAAIIGAGPQFRRIRRLLYDKYPQYPDVSDPPEDVGEIGPSTPACPERRMRGRLVAHLDCGPDGAGLDIAT
jgi:hypothetical protein